MCRGQLVPVSRQSHGRDGSRLTELSGRNIRDPVAGVRAQARVQSCRGPELTPKTAAKRTLEGEGSRRYQNRFLQPNAHIAAFFEIYKSSIPLRRKGM